MASIDKTGAKFIQISGEKHDINDIRIYTGETSPANNPDLSESVNGDIYFKKGYGVQSDDNWKYEIKNGLCECWRVVNLSSVAFSARWSSLVYVVDGVIGKRAYPVTFKSLPRATVSVICRGSNTVWVYTSEPGTTSMSPAWSLAALYGNTNSTDITVSIHVLGIVD